jgi:hypothetical protein
MCRVQEKELEGEVTIGIYTQSRFRRKTGGWSCQHILSRTLLAEKNSTIPKGELQSLTNASNMCWLLKKPL